MDVKNYFAFTKENKVIPFCDAYLYYAGTNDLVTGVKDKDGNDIDNPFKADENGLVQFTGPTGNYDLRFKSLLRDYRIRISIIDFDEVVGAITGALKTVATLPELKGASTGRSCLVASSGDVYQWAPTSTETATERSVIESNLTPTGRWRLAPDYLTSVGKQSITVYDDFDAPDRVLSGRIAPTGQVWGVSGTGSGTCSIVDGAVLSPAGDNFYASLNAGDTINNVEATFSFTADSVNSGGQVVLIAQTADLDLQDMLHFQITPDTWTLDIRVGGVWQNSVIQGRHHLAVDGTQYHAAVRRNGDDVILTLPSGEDVAYTDAGGDVSALPLEAGTWQIFGNATSGRWISRINSVAAGKEIAANRAVMLGGVSAKQVENISGFGLGRRKSVKHTITSDGWYRVAYGTTIEGFTIQAGLKISAVGLLPSQFEADVIEKSGVKPSTVGITCQTSDSALLRRALL